MVYEIPENLQAKFQKNFGKLEKSDFPAHFSLPSEALHSRADLTQLIAKPGDGARRLALSMMAPAKKVIWISQSWNLYAPLLWKIAEENKIQLLGLELTDKKRLRSLWRTLLEARVFDGWILDGLRLHTSEGLFLQKLTRLHPLKVLVLDERPHLFCHRRAHLTLNHHHYRLLWTKGGSEEKNLPRFSPSPLLQIFKEKSSDLCLS
ncbi:MAG: hypothetical protein J0L93_10685 [Deltaproteobacteria bacterium]|nr:hypothetical protein [Deltaproteobacteria bacterium]